MEPQAYIVPVAIFNEIYGLRQVNFALCELVNKLDAQIAEMATDIQRLGDSGRCIMCHQLLNKLCNQCHKQVPRCNGCGIRKCSVSKDGHIGNECFFCYAKRFNSSPTDSSPTDSNGS